MWKLYDDLYIGIPSGITITGVTIGRFWTTVRANGNIGIARTLAPPDDPAGVRPPDDTQKLTDPEFHRLPC
jgi:hypothetical protein